MPKRSKVKLRPGDEQRQRRGEQDQLGPERQAERAHVRGKTRPAGRPREDASSKAAERTERSIRAGPRWRGSP